MVQLRNLTSHKDVKLQQDLREVESKLNNLDDKFRDLNEDTRTWNKEQVFKGTLMVPDIKSGTTQAGAGAALDEIWHDTTDDTLKVGV